MKRTIDFTTKRILSISVLMVALLLGAAIAHADVVLDWNAIAVDTAIQNGANPFAQARYAAIVQLAVFEAVNSITRDYQPYLGTIVAPAGASADAAAAQAAHDVLVNYFHSSQTALDNQLAATLALIPDGQSKTDGIAVGQAAAAAMVALRANDGSAPLTFYTPGPPVPGAYQATPSCPVIGGVAKGAFLNWQNMTPFGIPDAHAYLLPPPPLLTSNQYVKVYDEVKDVGSLNSTDRPVDRSNVALYYAASTPTHVFNQAARQVALERYHSLSENARAFALINMAISDSFVAAFYNKYYYVFWRPETAIHAGASDGNPRTAGDPAYAPFIVTPCFPSYPANHGAGSGSAAEVLRRLYGEAGHLIILSNPAVPSIVLQYSRFGQILSDVSDARVYGGIHYRTDMEAGATLGQAVASAVVKHNLRSRNGRD